MIPEKIPELPFSYDSLEPYIDEKTMKIHHDMHHQKYLDSLNKALDEFPELKKRDALELLINLDEVPENIRIKVKFNCGGFVNHNYFWPLLKKNVPFRGDIADAIIERFGSIEDFSKLFKEKAAQIMGSGWAWLVMQNGELTITTTQNHDNPISEGMIPILVIDMWEHAYYLKYQNKKNEYIDAFLEIINWDAVNENYINA